MAYYEKPTGESFEKGDKVVVVTVGNPELEVAEGKQVISANKAAKRGITARGTPIEEVLTEDGELRDRFK